MGLSDMRIATLLGRLERLIAAATVHSMPQSGRTGAARAIRAKRPSGGCSAGVARAAALLIRPKVQMYSAAAATITRLSLALGALNKIEQAHDRARGIDRLAQFHGRRFQVAQAPPS